MAGARQHFVVPDGESVGDARRYAVDRAVAAGHADLADDLELVVSELVTNALLHAGPPVETHRDASAMRVAGRGRRPQCRRAAAGDREVVTAQLTPGDRLLLYTDGLIEARDEAGRFVELDAAVRSLPSAPLRAALEEILATLRDLVGGDLGDDLAMLLAQFDPELSPDAE